MNKYPSLSSECIKALRDTNFTGGRIDGLIFIRCGSRLARGEAAIFAQMVREATDDDEQQVCAAHNPEFAAEDYIRVATDSKAYAFICGLKA